MNIRRYAVVVAAVLMSAAVGCAPRGEPHGAQQSSASAVAAPTDFDLFTRYARFGWLPDGVVPWATMVQTGSDDIFMIEAGPPGTTVNTGMRFAATFFPRRSKPQTTCRYPAILTRTRTPPTRPAPWPAPSVRGATARWLYDTPAAVGLTWEYAPDAWAEIESDGLSLGGTALVHRIAEAIQIGGSERLLFPFQVTGVPPHMRPSAVLVSDESHPNWSGTAIFSSTQPYCHVIDRMAAGSLGLTVNASTPGPDWPTNTTVDGHKANRANYPNMHESLEVFDLPGPYVALSVADAGTLQQLGVDGLTGLYRRITMLGTVPKSSASEAPDRTRWTDRPFR